MIITRLWLLADGERSTLTHLLLVLVPLIGESGVTSTSDVSSTLHVTCGHWTPSESFTIS